MMPAPAAAQTGTRPSPYVSLDHPELPLLEHLIARGDIEDPSPFVRPFRRSDAVRVLAAADSLHPGNPAVAVLLQISAIPPTLNGGGRRRPRAARDTRGLAGTRCIRPVRATSRRTRRFASRRWRARWWP